MQQCPKCGSGVPDERTSCHICFADLGANAQAAGPAGLNFATPQSAAVLPQPADPASAPAPAIPVPPPPVRASGIPGLPAAPQQPAAQSVPGLPGVYAQQDTGIAQPNYLRGDSSAMAPQSSMGGGQTRVSLTGEVIDTPMSAPPISRTTGVSSGPPPRPGSPPMPVRRTGPASGPVREQIEGEKTGGGAFFLVLLILIVLGGGGFGGWYWYNNRTNPKDQALKVFTAVKEQSWADLYGVIAMNKADKAKYPDAAAFAKGQADQISKIPIAKAGLAALKSGTSEVKVADPTINGDKADVPISYKLSIQGINLTMNGTAHMVREGGIWKLDASSDNEAEGTKSVTDMFGKPDMSSLPGGGMPGMMGGGGMPGMAGGGGRSKR